MRNNSTPTVPNPPVSLALAACLALLLPACVGGSGSGGGYTGSAAAVDGGSVDGQTGSSDAGNTGESDTSSSGGTSSGGTSSGGTSSGGTSSGGTSSGGTSSGGTSSGGTSSGGTSSGGTSSGGTSSGGTSSGGTSSGGTSSGGTSSGGTTSTLVDKQCLDGKYTETLPNKDGDISGLLKNYDSKQYKSFITDVLAARYPFGKTLVDGALKAAPQDCVDTFLPASMRGTASSVMSRLGTIVHECGHFYDIYGGGGLANKQWVISPSVTFKCKGARATDSKMSGFGSNPSFPRSLLNSDKWSGKHPPCKSLSGAKGCDSYAYIYLNGAPDNGKFESGDQGYDNLVEEVTQYVNSIATGYAYQDQKGGFSSSSDRDGILNFLWYTERYLHMARTKHPDVYAFLSKDKCWRELTLTLWGRAWLYLETTKNNKNLGIQDAKLLGLVQDPELLNEIALLRKAQGCN